MTKETMETEFFGNMTLVGKSEFFSFEVEDEKGQKFLNEGFNAYWVLPANSKPGITGCEVVKKFMSKQRPEEYPLGEYEPRVVPVVVNGKMEYKAIGYRLVK